MKLPGSLYSLNADSSTLTLNVLLDLGTLVVLVPEGLGGGNDGWFPPVPGRPLPGPGGGAPPYPGGPGGGAPPYPGGPGGGSPPYPGVPFPGPGCPCC